MAFWKAFGTWISFTMAMFPRQIQWISTILGKCQNVILSKCGVSNYILVSFSIQVIFDIRKSMIPFQKITTYTKYILRRTYDFLMFIDSRFCGRKLF